MNEAYIWKRLKDAGLTDAGAAGLMGNLKQESGLNPRNVEDYYNNILGMTDDEYTEAVDNGYVDFCYDSVGYGIAQWTFYSRKENLLEFALEQGKSIGDLTMQLDFLCAEMAADFRSVWNTLKKASSVREASDAVMTKFENPADQSEAQKAYRASLGQAFLEKYAGLEIDLEAVTPESPVAPPSCTVTLYQLAKGSKGESVRALQNLLIDNDYDCGDFGADGDFGAATDKALRQFQEDNNLSADGICGTKTWSVLLGYGGKT